MLNPENELGIGEIYERGFESRYDARRFSINLRSVVHYIRGLDDDYAALGEDPEIARMLRELHQRLGTFFEDGS